MNRGWLSAPARDRPLAVGGLLLVAIVAAVTVVLLTGPHRSDLAPVRRSAAPALTTPSVIVGHRASPPAVTAAQRAAAARAARRFLASYLPVLYGRARLRTIRGADVHVDAELAAAARMPRAPRDRRPRIRRLTVHGQVHGTVVAVAVIADGVQKPYQIVCQLTDRHGRWRVSQLANY